VAQFVAKIGSLHLAIIGSVYFTADNILMDTVYGAADFLMIFISIRIIPLLYRPTSEKHPFGFSQVEAIFITIKGAMLTAVTAGLVLNNIQIMLAGGNHVAFDTISLFEFIATLICGAMALILTKLNKNLGSSIVKLEIDTWIIDFITSIGLTVAFILPIIVNTGWMKSFSPYLDQVVALALSAIILPTPIKTTLSGLRDVFLLAPNADTVKQIKEIGEQVLSKYGTEQTLYDIIKTGRKIWISIYFKSSEDIISISRIRQAHLELETELQKEFQDLYVELIPEFED
jgi:predicted Co/Zn/Cd cation transporter (cation efflux family)